MNQQPKWMTVTGWVLSVLPVLALLFSAFIKFRAPPEVVTAFTGKYGYPSGSLGVIGAVEVACALVFLLPQTSVLGAILIAGYLGGAASTHVRAGEPFFAPILVAVFAWAGLFLREPRLRALVPVRR